MKRTCLMIILILFLGVLCLSCRYKSKDYSNVAEESNTNMDESNPIQEARELMLDWQIKKIYQECNMSYDENNLYIPISTSQAVVYISQKELLVNNNEYKEKWGIDFTVAESKEETALLNELHEYLAYWMLMRENMRVLHTEKENDDYYSIVLTSGYDFLDGIYLVQYHVENEEVQVLNAFTAPESFSLQNVYLGVVNQNSPICFGVIKKLKYNSKENEWVNSDISNIKFLTTAGDYDIQVENSKPFITFLSKKSRVIGYKAMNSQGGIVEEKELTELDISYSLEK